MYLCNSIIAYKSRVIYTTFQSTENRGKECHWFERSNISFKENKLDGVDLSSSEVKHILLLIINKSIQN